MAEISMMLSQYLAAEGRRPFAWGETDCLMLIGGWVALCTGIDPRVPYRGYRSENDAASIIASAGGMVRLLDAAFSPCGVGRTDRPRPGDVGVVLAPCIFGTSVETGAIRTSMGWTRRKLRGGLVCDGAPAIAIWNVANA